MTRHPHETRKFDVRLIERNIKHGQLDPGDVREHLSALPDVTAKAVRLGEMEEHRRGDDGLGGAPRYGF